MQSRWNEREAAEAIERWKDVGNDLALRVYTSRLIGAERALVLHGGGNTSVKTRLADALGIEHEVLCVKGSGWDLKTIEPAGLPALELAPLRAMERLSQLDDETMTNELRRRLLDVRAPNPSVETLLHAFLPHRFVDHTHADAICVLTNQPDGELRVREALGDEVLVLPWIMPGFPLAKAVAAAQRAAPRCVGIVLRHHGLFTFGDDARTSYERTIELVTRAERYLAARGGSPPPLLAAAPRSSEREARRELAAALPRLRGALARRDAQGEVTTRFLADARTADDLRAFSAAEVARALVEDEGPLTPDHVLRTKGPYLYLARAAWSDAAATRAAVERFEQRYRAYFAAHRARVAKPRELDPKPRVAVLEDLGVVGFGADAKAAAIAADIAEHTVRGKALGAALGTYRALSPGELFEMEYWSLEQAKLGEKKAPPLQGRVALVTGAGGAIGHGICAELLDAGAHVVATDFDAALLERAGALLRATHGDSRLHLLAGIDVTDEVALARAFDEATLRFGGVDIVVPNAGIAYAAPLAELEVARLRRVLEVNTLGVALTLRAAARHFALEGSGGDIVVQASKNVFAPGAGFGAYSASKAGAHQLGKIAALELAPLGVRVNLVHADAVFGGEVPSGLWAEIGPERMRARGLSEHELRDFYRERSLLKREVTPRHVGRAVVACVRDLTRTTGATLPVDGGLPEAFPR
ncbi:MAG: bifunctional aldolase/short-chain dehydrogenase [Planctomycetes bacterium]|nr:bifunctional aldolase/short-chain dehydrogenase [Planctomycetota bacterium]